MLILILLMNIPKNLLMKYYFRCSGAEVIEMLLKNKKIDYTIYKNNDLYLIFTNNIRK